MIKEFLERISDRKDLSFEEAQLVMHKIMRGEVNEAQIAALLLGLKTKKETSEEIAGFAKAMREHSIKINNHHENVIDVCGTGGDGSYTFNISTAVSFVVAGANVKVAKHGNRSISSKSGSADVLTELGININLTQQQSEEALEKIGITFLFAPNYHPTMKYAAPVRKALGVKTIFNVLGPLTNPAQTKRQLIGVYNSETAKLMAEACKYLDMEKVAFISTINCFDEISLTAETEVFEYTNGAIIINYKIDHNNFGYTKIELKNIQSDSAQKNAEIILSILRDKRKNDAFFVVAANAAFALYVAGICNDIKICKEIAEESILSGKAYEKLTALKYFKKRYA